MVKLYEDSKGRIWVGTENAGLNIYDKSNGKFYRIAQVVSDPFSLSGNEIKGLVELPGGKMLVSTEMPGLNIVDAGNEFYSRGAAPVITKLSLPNEVQVYGMGKDKGNNIWVGGMDGAVYRFDPAANRFIPLPGAKLLNNGYFTPDGSILINNNLFLYDGQNATPLFDTETTPLGNIIFKPNHSLWDKHHRELYFYDVSKLEPGNHCNGTNNYRPPPVWYILSLLIVRVLYGLAPWDTDYANTMPPPVNSGHSFQVTAYGLLYQPMQTRSFWRFRVWMEADAE